MSFPYTTLTYNVSTKIVSNELLESLTHPKRVQTIQWYRYQLLEMCKKLDIPVKDNKTGNVYNNMTLADRIKNHNLYGSIVIRPDDMKYGLKPCINSKSIAPQVVSKSQLVKRKNNVTLKDPEYIVWKCGVSNKPLLDL